MRFLAGQSVTLRVGQSYSSDLPVASCPCDDRNVLFHISNKRQPVLRLHIRSTQTKRRGGDGRAAGEFILHEKSPRPSYFFAFDTGFAPIKSLIEHALSLEAETICLHWFGSNRQNIYLPNIAHAWQDALDNFHYEEHIAGFDLHTVSSKRKETLLKQLANINSGDANLLQGDIYIAGPGNAVSVAEQFFLDKGLPKTRVVIASVK